MVAKKEQQKQQKKTLNMFEGEIYARIRIDICMGKNIAKRL